ncbi:hypothetical protein [Streptomyces sp. URMC 129]|uniref:hypothetical protein n=1 Tax=Streptomyces sp. URMC 129 TaxID=3423407 RepID=UPI003F1C715A
MPRDPVATVPERRTANPRQGVWSFPLPFRVPGPTVSPLGHARLGADPAHRWPRDRVFAVCRAGGEDWPGEG